MLPGKEGNPCSSGGIRRRNHSTPGAHHTGRLKSSGGSDQPRRRGRPPPPRPTPADPRPAHPAPGRALGERRVPRAQPGASRTRWGRRQFPGSPPPYLSCQGLRARLRAPPKTDAQALAGARPARKGCPPRPHGLPAVPPDPCRPVPGPLAAEAQRRSGSGEHATLPRRPARVKYCALSAAEKTSIRHKAGHLERNKRVRTVHGKPIRTTGKRRAVASDLCRQRVDSPERSLRIPLR